mmetsp:Transcript_55050/g.66278  ORF Transcript_55050/g.66278 Transcript_55050/m.66278 type:complete len:144 (-) Transcript_55050:372-803(-)
MRLFGGIFESGGVWDMAMIIPLVRFQREGGWGRGRGGNIVYEIFRFVKAGVEVARGGGGGFTVLLTLVFDILKTLPFLWVANDDKDDDGRLSDSLSLSKSVAVPPRWTVPAAADAYEVFLITSRAAPSASIQNLPICRPRMLS